jgi:hypothetical protein
MRVANHGSMRAANDNLRQSRLLLELWPRGGRLRAGRTWLRVRNVWGKGGVRRGGVPANADDMKAILENLYGEI